jgi:hypothetical protein
MKSKRCKPHPETYDQAMLLLYTIIMQRNEGVPAALAYLFKEWPALRQSTHAHIGELLGLSRETISRNFWKAF